MEKTSSSADVTKNGVRVVSLHTEDATYHGERKTVDGTTKEEHLSRHKVVHDRKATTSGADTEVENVSSICDGRRDLDKSLHHESEELVHRDLTRTHSWTEGEGTKHSKYYSEDFDKGYVEAVEKTSSSSDVIKNGVRVVSQYTDDATYHGERKTVDGTTKEEHLSRHKVVYDHKATTSGADTEVENVSSTYDGRRDLDKSLHHESEELVHRDLTRTHSWTEGDGVKHSYCSEDFNKGYVEAVEKTSSSSDVIKNGVRVVSQHTEDATYQGERKTVDGTTKEEHFPVTRWFMTTKLPQVAQTRRSRTSPLLMMVLVQRTVPMALLTAPSGLGCAKQQHGSLLS